MRTNFDTLTNDKADEQVRDPDHQGLILRLGTARRPTFMHQYRLPGSTKNATVTYGPRGAVPESIKAAVRVKPETVYSAAIYDHELAVLRWHLERTLIAAGRDPRQEADARAVAARHATHEGATVGDVLKVYLDQQLGERSVNRRGKPMKEKYRHDVRKRLTKWLADPEKPAARLGRLRLDALDVAHINAIVAEAGKTLNAAGAPVTSLARKLDMDIRSFVDWCVEDGRLKANPLPTKRTKTLQQLGRDGVRERVLGMNPVTKKIDNLTELGAVLRAISQENYPSRQAFQMLFLTAARRDEVLAMEKTELSDDEWTIPAERAKNGRRHTLPLTARTRAVLNEVPSNGSVYVFTKGGSGSRKAMAPPLSTLGSAWKADGTRANDGRRAMTRVVARAEAELGYAMAAWTIHDIRRTVSEHLRNRLGVAPHVVEAILNHAKEGLANYDRGRPLEQMRAALEVWGKELERIETEERTVKLLPAPSQKTLPASAMADANGC